MTCGDEQRQTYRLSRYWHRGHAPVHWFCLVLESCYAVGTLLSARAEGCKLAPLPICRRRSCCLAPVGG